MRNLRLGTEMNFPTENKTKMGQYHHRMFNEDRDFGGACC